MWMLAVHKLACSGSSVSFSFSYSVTRREGDRDSFRDPGQNDDGTNL